MHVITSPTQAQSDRHMQKQYISAGSLLKDAFELALQILESHYKPDLIIGVWRGGTPVGIAIQEALEFAGIHSDHIAIRTSSYTNIGKRTRVSVHGLDYLRRHFSANESLLLVDDVFDTGLSLQQVIRELRDIYQDNLPQIRIATPYYKPANNQTRRKPDFYLHETDNWLVFPHELIGLSDEEILQNKSDMGTTRQRLLLARRKDQDSDS
jgi:hypoxanthine phosphoribosyltransferase